MYLTTRVISGHEESDYKTEVVREVGYLNAEDTLLLYILEYSVENKREWHLFRGGPSRFFLALSHFRADSATSETLVNNGNKNSANLRYPKEGREERSVADITPLLHIEFDRWVVGGIEAWRGTG